MMTVLLYLAVVISSCGQSVCAKLNQSAAGEPYRFNAEKAGVACVLFLALSVRGFEPHLPTLLYGMLFGLALSASMYFGYLALSVGPMALTSLIVSFSLSLPVLYGICFLKESVSAFQMVGFALLVVSMVCAYWRRGGKKPVSVRWGLYTLFTLLGNGVCSIVQKQHQLMYPGQYRSLFMAGAMLVASLIFVGLLLSHKPKAKAKSRFRPYGLFAGLATASANALTLVLAGMENASVLFPLLSAGTILAAFLSGRFIFKEKLTMIQRAGFCVGIAAVVFLKL